MSSTLPYLVPKRPAENVSSEDACPMPDDSSSTYPNKDNDLCDWTPIMQSMVFASFSYGFIATHLPGTVKDRDR